MLLHPTSLAEGPSIGSIGDAARRWVDWLDQAGFRLWQVLPLAPPATGWSPYSTWSSRAISPWLIDLQDLARDGLLPKQIAEAEPQARPHVDYPTMAAFKGQALETAAEQALRSPGAKASIESFRHAHSWVDDTALFAALTRRYEERPWWTWPREVRARETASLDGLARQERERVDRHAAFQWMAFTQWQALREHAASRRVRIVGDLPIYCDPHSADTWAHPELFHLTEDGEPAAMAGVPPDAFSATGQLWRSPTYRWEVHRADGFGWWCDRVASALSLGDLLRLDHFRGFVSYWSVPGGSEDARTGSWIPGPGRELFEAIASRHGEVGWIAEDLGYVDEQVHALRDGLGIPGTAVLQFGFGAQGDALHRPDVVGHHQMVATGTHDTDTLVGWWTGLDASEQEEINEAMPVDFDRPHEGLLRAVLSCRADTAIVPVQDLLGLGSEARMNIPGTPEGNWIWRLSKTALSEPLAQRLRSWNEASGR